MGTTYLALLPEAGMRRFSSGFIGWAFPFLQPCPSGGQSLCLHFFLMTKQ